jgi:hypothetical protein
MFRKALFTVRLVTFYLLALFVGCIIIESDIITGHHTNISYISRTALWADRPKKEIKEPTIE